MRIIVVGGGILGASAAFHLAALEPAAAITLIDAAHPGRATAAGAGIICPWLSEAGPDWAQIAEAGASYYPELVARLAEHGETDISYRRVGALAVGPNAAELDRTERHVRTRAAAAPQAGAITRLSPAEARALFPPLHPDFAAVHVAGGARIDGRRLAAALRSAAERAGAEVRAGEVAALSETAGRITGLRLQTGETIGADAVVLAAGVWAPALVAPLGLQLPIAPQRGQIVHLRLEGTDTSAWPIVLPPGPHYLLAFDAGRVVAGAARETGAGLDNRVTAAGQAEILNQALAVAPGLASATLIETRVGFRPLGPTPTPMLGPAGPSGLLIGNALGPSGLTVGPYAGHLVAQLALGQPPDLDLTPYNPLRTPEPAATATHARIR